MGRTTMGPAAMAIQFRLGNQQQRLCRHHSDGSGKFLDKEKMKARLHGARCR